MLTRENRSTQRKISLSATLSITNLTWTGLLLNPGVCSESPETNRVSHGTAIKVACMFFLSLTL
jgi:hypothetical protein